MRKAVFVALLFSFIIAAPGCIKDEGCKPKTIESEDGSMQAYATAQGISATKHSSGLYYQVVSQGTGTAASLTSRIWVKYTGKLLDGTVFDSGTTPTTPNGGGWSLGSLIRGWQIGIPLIQKGGKIKLIIPSSLGYGCNAQGPIPSNAILFFDVELTDVQ
jgi:FKBP-type peptidyl-prolyl cis-trans isomerase FkpA